jgi:hypothetical protein
LPAPNKKDTSIFFYNLKYMGGKQFEGLKSSFAGVEIPYTVFAGMKITWGSLIGLEDSK